MVADIRRPEMMTCELDTRRLYEALRARDRRFDGRFFVAVRSTRIYCRPVCTVRPPKFENCTFLPTAAACEQAGYRPCLRCRPEIAPGTVAPVDAVSRIASLAVRRIEDGALSGGGLEDLAAEFGITGRHLRRVLCTETGQSPLELAQTQRLLLSKQLLTDTKMSVTEVAFAAGFESLRRFNHAFKTRYRLTPTGLRRTGPKLPDQDAYAFELAIRPPIDLPSLLTYWTARATAGVEHVSNNDYQRTVAIGKRTGWVSIRPGAHSHTVRVIISSSLGPALTTVLARLKHMLDTRSDPLEVGKFLADDPLLVESVRNYPDVRIPGAFDGFECAIRTVLGQQISVRGATTLAGRLANRFGRPIASPIEGLTTLFPTPESLAEASVNELTSLGLTGRRAETIKGLAYAFADEQVRLEPGTDPDGVRSTLLGLPGIGDWTVEYLLLRACGWPDAFPAGDLGLQKAAKLSANKLRDRAERWRPWRGHAAMLLWRSLANPTV